MNRRIVPEAVTEDGSSGAKADKQAILWSWKNLKEWGCCTPEGMEKVRKGGSLKITKGPNAGDGIAWDHVLPRAVVPELAARFYNLEAIPSNLQKSAKITAREVNLARRWNREGLLSSDGLRAIEAKNRESPEAIDRGKRKYLAQYSDVRDPNSIRTTLASVLRNAAAVFSKQALAAFRAFGLEIENPFLASRLKGIKIKTYSPLPREVLNQATSPPRSACSTPRSSWATPLPM